MQKIIEDEINEFKKLNPDATIDEAMYFAYLAGSRSRVRTYFKAMAEEVWNKHKKPILIGIAVAISLALVCLNRGTSSVTLRGECVDDLIESYTRQTGNKVFPYRRNLCKERCKNAPESEWADIVLKTCREVEK